LPLSLDGGGFGGATRFLRGVVDLSPLIGLLFPDILGGVNTGDGRAFSLMGEGGPSTLDTAVDEDAFEEVDENEFVELPDVDRIVFPTKLGTDFTDDDT